MIVIVGSLPIDRSKIDDLTAAVSTMRAASLAEDGCSEYRFSFAIDDPSVMLIVEEWRDDEALDAHGRTEHMAVFRGAMAGFVVGAPTVTRYEATSKGPLS